MSEIKNILDGIHGGLDIVEETTSELENRAVEIIQNET